ncbi:MAG: hypothetical protein GY913_26505 [Proteobacteria bacterium]|nr:hypothetical protein [Pseudomonadota bacterium]MCP4920469.1 hypothetical protein [Pseudomonadota bacterium]
MQWLDDRLNPILVKEVRQALRSRYFWGTYALALAAATIIGSFLLGMVDDPDELGAVFFGVVYFCLAASTMGLVPFQAFLAAGGTWDAERTNLLLLTALTPRQIVQGRLMASVVQIGLLFLALLPFLGLGFLMPGVDLGAFGVILLTTLLFGAFLSAVTIAASWLTANKLLRVLLMTVIGGGLLWMVGIAVAASSELVRSPDVMADDEFKWAWMAIVFHGGAVAALAFAAAVARISHPESNRSRPLRILVAALCLVGHIGVYWVQYSGSGEDELPLVMFAYLCFVLTVPMMGFLTEPEVLGRRVWLDVPKKFAALSSPLQPGSGNGFIYLTVLLGSMVFFVCLVPPIDVRDWTGEYVPGVLTAAGYLYIAVGLPTAPFARWTHHLWVRVVSVFSVPAFCMCALFLPALYGAIIDDWDLENFEHIGSPIYAIEWATRDHNMIHPAIVIGVAVTFLVNLPRMMRGLAMLNRARKAVPEASGGSAPA